MPAVYCEIIKYAVGTQAASEFTLFGQVFFGAIRSSTWRS